MLHDNAKPHKANATNHFLDSLGWVVLKHPTYFSDVVLSNNYIFTSANMPMGVNKFPVDKEVKAEAEKQERRWWQNFWGRHNTDTHDWLLTHRDTLSHHLNREEWWLCEKKTYIYVYIIYYLMYFFFFLSL